ncbi:hypothetical protein EXIGLDRAFT_56614 [Exidia glandulosa HHB12029]|uniref:Uncharacterized protein n=1 Tax=Exidia glandulosa HHB12029 TaxID=1314781 RepID=A0A165I7F0_EXIGL|nr:hypothetical protein EXIGLDRAFT_56614 [Exidia glandulosa HHB12029]
MSQPPHRPPYTPPQGYAYPGYSAPPPPQRMASQYPAVWPPRQPASSPLVRGTSVDPSPLDPAQRAIRRPGHTGPYHVANTSISNSSQGYVPVDAGAYLGPPRRPYAGSSQGSLTPPSPARPLGYGQQPLCMSTLAYSLT